MIKASQKKDWSGLYDPPGGHIEKGEDILASAVREIKEETGLSVEDTKLRGVMHVTNFYGKNIMMFVTTSTAKEKDVRDSDEGELTWVRFDDLDTLPVIADIKSLLAYIKKLPHDTLFVGTSEFDGANNLVDITLRSN